LENSVYQIGDVGSVVRMPVQTGRRSSLTCGLEYRPTLLGEPITHHALYD